MADTLDTRLNDSFAAGELPGLHGVIVDLADQRLAESYFSGADHRWGDPLGVRSHSPETLHDLRSVTKSVVGLLYGIALARGEVPGPDQPLYAQFPDHADLAQEPGRDRIQIHHALSMQMGLKWSEDLPYSDPGNSEIAMEMAPDRYRYVLEQPILEDPGQSWTYSGGATALIGKIIADGTGLPLDAFAKENLFDPLGITSFEWIAGQDGVPSAASGLRLTLPDLAKIGKMVAQDGVHGGQQIVPADWLNQSFQPRATLDEFTKYGYLWYLSGTPDNLVVFAAGNGGQRLTVQPRVGLVVASLAGNYDQPEAWRLPLNIVLNFAVPEVQRILDQ